MGGILLIYNTYVYVIHFLVSRTDIHECNVPTNPQGNFYTAISRLWELWHGNMWVIMDDTFNFHLPSVPSRINGRRHPSTLAWLTSTQILFKSHFQHLGTYKILKPWSYPHHQQIPQQEILAHSLGFRVQTQCQPNSIKSDKLAPCKKSLEPVESALCKICLHCLQVSL